MGMVLAELARRAPVRNGAKSVLLNLGLSASDQTGLWRGSLPALAEGSGLSKRSAQRILRGLEREGLIAVERQAGRGNLSTFRVLLAAGDCAPFKPGRERASAGEA